MLRLAEVLRKTGISQWRLAQQAGISRPALNALIVRGDYLKRVAPETTRRAIVAALAVLGVRFDLLGGLFETVTAPCENTAPSGEALLQEVHMLIRKQRLSNAACQAFGLTAEALEAPTRREQVFLAGEMAVGYEHLVAKARFGGMLALVGESGSGKTTLKNLLITDLHKRDDELIVIEPHPQAMEENDSTGKTLKAAHIAEAILREVAPAERPKLSSEARLNQVEEALSRSAKENRKRRHLLVIEEAHCLPTATLKHLKRFHEFKQRGAGLQPALLSIVLLGQPELAVRLSRTNQNVREVWQRCELVTLKPLDREFADYLKFVLGEAVSVFDPSAIDELRTVLTSAEGVSYLHPLVINNWLAVILNDAARLGAKRIVANSVDKTKNLITKQLEREGC